MRIFNQDKTQEITNPDLTLGYLVNDRLFIAHHEATPEIKMQGHVEPFTNEFGLPDENFVIDVEYSPAREAWDEYENIYVYKLYSTEEIQTREAKQSIEEAKKYLEQTDYIVLKIAEAQSEGDMESVAALREEYALQLQSRKTARDSINASELILFSGGV